MLGLPDPARPAGGTGLLGCGAAPHALQLHPHPAYAYIEDDTSNLKSTFAAILGSMTELRLTE